MVSYDELIAKGIKVPTRAGGGSIPPFKIAVSNLPTIGLGQVKNKNLQEVKSSAGSTRFVPAVTTQRYLPSGAANPYALQSQSALVPKFTKKQYEEARAYTYPAYAKPSPAKIPQRRLSFFNY